MTKEQIWDWQCLMFLYASVLYYEWDLSVWSDELFDEHCHILNTHYRHLPPWFRSRVSQDDLAAGTGFAVVVTNDERREAVEWYERLHGSL